MRRIIAILLFVMICLFFITNNIAYAFESSESAFYSEILNAEYDKCSVIVVLKNEYSLNKYDYLEDFTDFEGVSILELTKDIDETKYKKEKQNYFHKILCLSFEEKNTDELIELIDLLMEKECVLTVTPNYVYECAYVPGDAYYGVTAHWGAEYINLPDTWNFTLGSHDVKVGVLDSGIDENHLDLSGNVNTYYSRDFTSGTPQTLTTVTDAFGHGTHVAGIIGACTNSIGICGTSPNVELISLRIFDSNGSGLLSNIVLGITYAETIELPILNFSGSVRYMDLGSGQSNYISSFEAAISNYSGLLVCAAGNHSMNIDSGYNPPYPAYLNYDNVLAVGAIDSNGNKCSFSNYGQNKVDIYAPGGDILSTYPTSLYMTGSVGTLGSHYSSGYAIMSGTSMSSPYVAGVAALLLSLNPGLDYADLSDCILSGADTVYMLVYSNPEFEIYDYQYVKVLDAFESLKYAFYNYAFSDYTLSGTSLNISKYCSFTYEYISLNEAIVRINLSGSPIIGFTISSTYAIDAMLLNPNLQQISVSKTFSNNNTTITFGKRISLSYFYIKVYFTNNMNAATISISLAKSIL